MIEGERQRHVEQVVRGFKVSLGQVGQSTYETSSPLECSQGAPLEPCLATRMASRPRANTEPRPFEIRGGALVRTVRDRDASPEVTLPPGDWVESSQSPSGRWVLVEGNFRESDYVYRDLLLLDGWQGDLYPIREGDLSVPLDISQLDQPGTNAIDTVTVVGETAVRWQPTAEVLIVGSLLVLPGNSGTDLKGDVAD